VQKAHQLTLIAEIVDVLRPERQLGPGYDIRETTDQDVSELADLYFAAYSPEMVKDLPAAREEIEQAFRGEYGRLDLTASPVVIHGGVIVGSVTTVDEAPWDDTPPGPFIIEVMVHPDHRRRGLAECMIKAAAGRLAKAGRQTVALRVMSDNTKALPLYHRLGFASWTET
jgi:ribosomal-protein-alanine N-acetyltransferase